MSSSNDGLEVQKACFTWFFDVFERVGTVVADEEQICSEDAHFGFKNALEDRSEKTSFNEF